ncbi:MAG: spondin domain-containing protein [Xenococcaceae cyanobacterium MO_167.B27]|nr:spondin domain-containing protein [Xenococcaceae cyanobacterium MO_167.B27]
MNYNNIVLPKQQVTLEVTVENLSPENGGVITPVWFGLHDGSFDTFEVGEAASSGVMYIAEDGVTGLEGTVPGVVEALIEAGLDPADLPPQEATLGGIFADSSAAANGGTQGIVDSAESPLGVAPGQSLSVTVDINSNNLANNRFFNYAAMFFPSNDGFVANDDAIELFDEKGNFVGTDILVTRNEVWDAGTEVNEETPESVPFSLDVTGDGIDENGTVQSHQGFLQPGSGGVLDYNDGVFANAEFTNSDDPIARIIINPVINGTDDSDLIFGTKNREKIRGFEGDDLILSRRGDDTVEGGAGSDRIFGQRGDDYLLGDSGDDVIRGGAGDDVIDGGLDDDKIWGNSGADQFVLRASDGQDTIFDYKDGVDSFVLADGLVFEDLTITQGAGRVELEITDTQKELATLIGVSANDLGAEDFITTTEF